MHRRLRVVQQVHGDLGAPSLACDPHGLHGDQAAARFARRLCNLLGDFHIIRGEVDVVGNQRPAGSDDHRAGGGMRLRISHIGHPLRVGHLRSQSFILPLANVREAAAFRPRCRLGIEVDRHPQRVPDLPAKILRRGHTLLHRHPGDGDKGDHVHRAQAGVLPAVRSHVDALHGPPCGGQRCMRNRPQVPHEGDDAAVMALVGLHIEHPRARGLAHFPGDRLDDVPAPALAEVRDTFHQLPHRLPRKTVLCFCAL